MIYPLLRRGLFRIPPETAHGLTIQLVRAVGTVPGLPKALTMLASLPDHPVQAFGLTFPNPIGLAAGYDKDAQAWRGLGALGFGHIEVGTVTPLPQAGQPRPRLFRLPEDRSLINRMGFPGQGAEKVALRLDRPRSNRPLLGVNLGKNDQTPLEEAAGDYLALLRRFAPLADYLAINVSCPNTPELRRLQTREYLESLLNALARERARLPRRVPILVKISPDLDDAELEDTLQAVLASGMDGVIATNTTTERPPLRSRHHGEEGGLSGAALRQRSTERIRWIRRRTEGQLPIVGLGGIETIEHAREKLDAGACLVQLYTGLIYQGPLLVHRILRALATDPR